MKLTLGMAAMVTALAFTGCSGEVSVGSTDDETTKAADKEKKKDEKSDDADKKLSGDRLESLITADAEKQGVKVDEIDCPDALTAEVGHEVECSMTDSQGREWDIKVVSEGLGENGTTINFEWDATTDAPGGGTTPSDEPSDAPSGGGDDKAEGALLPGGDGNISATSLEVQLSSVLGQMVDTHLVGDCPGPLKPEPGSTVTCTMKASEGREFQVKVVSTGKQSDRKIHFTVEVVD